MLTTQEVLENFELLDDWESRYAYLVELGVGACRRRPR